jgi:hypothetical protein
MCICSCGPWEYNHGCPNLAQIKIKILCLCTRLGHPMVTFLGSTWMSTHCLIMLRKSSQIRIFSWHVCIQPPSILKHLSVAMTRLLGSHYGHLTTSDTFSSLSCMHIEFEAKATHTQPILLFSSTLVHRNACL